MSRLVLDASSSTSGNVRHFIKNTGLSDIAPSQSDTQPSSSHSIRGGSGWQLQKESLLEESNEDKSEHSGQESPVSVTASAPQFEYQNKLKYRTNADFKPHGESSAAYPSLSYSPLSIPNTFKYKSHPNAKTKLKLGYNEYNDSNHASSDRQGSEVDLTRAEDLHPQEHNDAKTRNDFADDSQPPVTSTMKETQSKNDTTPHWMPDVLSEKWAPPASVHFDQQSLNCNDFGSSVRIHKPSSDKATNNNSDLQLDLNSMGSTMIHNSKTSLKNATPEWVKATREYEAKKQRNQLQNIFLSASEDNSGNGSGNVDSVANMGGGQTVSSTASTPIPSLTNRDVEELQQLTQEQIKEMLAHVDSNSKNPESPLKLFGDKYNTYTKNQLTSILQKVHNKSPTIHPEQLPNAEQTPHGLMTIDEKPQARSEVDQPPSRLESPQQSLHFVIPLLVEPRMKIKTFTRSGSYTEKEFLQNADNIFKDLQLRGFKKSMRDVTNNSQHLKPIKARIASSTTSTSTPKNDKVTNISDIVDNSTFTSDESDDGLENEALPPRASQSITNNDFTSFEATSAGPEPRYGQLSPKNLKHLQKQFSNEMASSYTYDGTESESEPSHIQQQRTPNSPPPPDQGLNQINQRLSELEDVLKHKYDEEIAQLRQENKNLQDRLQHKIENHATFDQGSIHEMSLESMDFTHEETGHAEDPIRWKRRSQLVLSETPLPAKKSPPANEYIRGRVNPSDDLPIEYNNMVYDATNRKWISNEVQEENKGSLDSIEDLVSDKELTHQNKSGSLLKNRRKSVNGNKLEVSFHLPNLTAESEDDFRARNVSGVTNVSQLHDSTFSLTRKRLISIITDVLSSEPLNWDEVLELSLASSEIDGLKDLDHFLPNVKSLDLSDNRVRFLDGIPKQVLNLDLSNNALDNLTSFKQFRDLQVLKASHNALTAMGTFSQNIHLTELNLSDNKLQSIQGINQLTNLVSLDLSNNEIGGLVQFSSTLRNLQVLNLAENDIHIMNGVEKLTKLRVLTLNENPRLSNISCSGKHLYLKKLCVKFCNLAELELECFPFLRVLRIDGNRLITLKDQLRKLRFLEELSCKSQLAPKSAILRDVFETATEVQSLDMSGNLNVDFELCHKIFHNVTKLTLSAMNLTTLPHNFSDMFPNVRNLNLNFNRLHSIKALSGLTNLKRVHMISNHIDKILTVVESSSRSLRKTLQVLDLRLNEVNIDFYPFVFNEHELEYSQHIKATSDVDILPIQLETLDDVESFGILYQSLNKSYDQWVERDARFLELLKSNPAEHAKVKRRYDYEVIMVSLFPNIKRLDGSLITKEARTALKAARN